MFGWGGGAEFQLGHDIPDTIKFPKKVNDIFVKLVKEKRD